MHPDPASTTGRRFTALVLAFLFLLQSAAQAGSGCLPSVLRARCCCAIAELEASRARAVATKAPAHARSCCAQRPVAHGSRGQGRSVEPRGGCRCELAFVPSAPSDAGSSWSRDGARDLRSAIPLAHDVLTFGGVLAHETLSTSSSLAPSPPGSPPRCAASSTITRLDQRGVIGLLSDLGTFLE